MKIGIIGAGRVGCSLGKYLKEGGTSVLGYYDTFLEAAQSAAEFTKTKCFDTLEELAAASDILFITTPDTIIPQVWEQLRELPLAGKRVCHCSGALSSQKAFSGIENTQALGCSIHPMLPFSNRFSSYQQLKQAFFTIEGQEQAVREITALFTDLGNRVCQIQETDKEKYHAAASMISNQVVAVLDTGFQLLTECGFSREEAVHAASVLIKQNIENVLQSDCVEALTGPIERNDTGTVRKHKDCLEEEVWEMYQVLGKRLVKIAQQKHPKWDYTAMLELLCEGKYEKGERR